MKIFDWLFKKEDLFTIQSVNKPTKLLINDPFYPNLVKEISMPQQTSMRLRVKEFNGTGNQINTPNWQAENALAHALLLMNELMPHIGIRNSWATQTELEMVCRAGKAVNAFYDRKHLMYFYYNVSGKTYFMCDSADIVCHEVGHAILDSMRPDLWSTASIEVASFHEAFGDITASSHALFEDEILNSINMRESNMASRIGEQVGVSLGLRNCTRDIFNSYEYASPNTLPTNNPNGISRECHDFSKIFSGAYWECLIRVYLKLGGNKENLKEARDYMLGMLYGGVRRAPNSVNFYENFAKSMIIEDQNRGGKHSDVLKDVFSRRKIIKNTLNAQSLDYSKDVAVRKTIKLSELNLDLLTTQSLSDFEIVLPCDPEITEGDFSMQSSTHEKAVEEAKVMVEHILTNNLIGGEWDIKDGVLTRDHIACQGFKPNCLVFGSPEYGKCPKPQNNTGCCTYGSCWRKPPEPVVPPKRFCGARYSTCNSGVKISTGTNCRNS